MVFRFYESRISSSIERNLTVFDLLSEMSDLENRLCEHDTWFC